MSSDRTVVDYRCDTWMMYLSLCPQTSDWTEDELSLLSRLMVKFPGGTPGRWEKIAHELGRSVSEVSLIKLVSNQFMLSRSDLR